VDLRGPRQRKTQCKPRPQELKPELLHSRLTARLKSCLPGSSAIPSNAENGLVPDYFGVFRGHQDALQLQGIVQP